MANNLLSKPTLSGLMRESPNFKLTNTGQTDSILLIGHADALVLYEPYQVVDIKQAVNFLKADIQSPLMRGLLEAYNGGCKDIWLYAAAPMSEYVITADNRFEIVGGKTFYQRWFDRLTAAYLALSDWDFADIVVPIEAVFYDAGGVDFATQLTNFCANTFLVTGAVCLGVLGTRINLPTQTAITNMVNDSRIANIGDGGKFVIVAVGEGIIQHPQVSNSYSGSLAVQVAANLATISLGRSIAGVKLPGVSALVGPNYTTAQIEAMTQAKLNPLVRTQRGKRGGTFEVRMLTDNTMGADGSDYWSMAQMRIVANCINRVRSYGQAFIGESLNDKFAEAVEDYLNLLRDNEYIRDFTLSISPENLRSSRLDVTISIRPIFGIRNIFFAVEVGAGV